MLHGFWYLSSLTSDWTRAPCSRSAESSLPGHQKISLIQYCKSTVVAQSLSRVCSTPSFPVLRYLPGYAQTHVHWVDVTQPSHPLLSPSPLVLNLSQHQSLSNESALHNRWPKYWSLSLSISPSNEYSGLISFRIDWVDLLAVQGTLKTLLQHHHSKASIFRCSAFFTVQMSHLYMTTGKTIALTIRTFVSKVMSLLFNALSSFVKFFFQGATST